MHNNINSLISKQAEELQEKLKQMKQEQQVLPKGKLTVAKDRKWVKLYRTIDGERFYIPQKEQELAKQLAKRQYLEAKIHDYERTLKACNTFLRQTNFLPAVTEYESEDGRYYPYVFSNTLKNEIVTWYKSDYDRCDRYPEKRIHKSNSGNKLRSKSEVLIDEMLYRYGLMYHYEEKLVLSNGYILYPDFKVFSEKFKRFIFWEHLGMIDDASYLAANFKKMQQYLADGIIPNRDLIITSESKDVPLDYEFVDFYIHQFLLN